MPVFLDIEAQLDRIGAGRGSGASWAAGGGVSMRPAWGGEAGVEFANGQETLTSRLAQWFAAFVQDAGAAPSAVGERPESVGAVNRNATGAVQQGDASREVIREQSARLIDRAT